MGRPPKPIAERRNRGQLSTIYVPLSAAGREGDPPPLPTWRRWSTATEEWWSDMWAKPQATQWDQTGTSLHLAALLYDQIVSPDLEPARLPKLLSELRAFEDRHGLSPRAMNLLHWFVEDSDADTRTAAARAADRWSTTIPETSAAVAGTTPQRPRPRAIDPTDSAPKRRRAKPPHSEPPAA